MAMKTTVVVVLVNLFVGTAIAGDKQLFCYYQPTAISRANSGRLDVLNLDKDLCSHYAFDFFGLNENGSLTIMDRWDDILQQNNVRVSMVKAKNPNLKVLASLGRTAEGYQKYSEVAADASKRQNLANEILNFLEQHEYDGFDVKWQFPATSDGVNKNDKANIVLLLKEIKSLLSPKGYILSAAVSGNPQIINSLYDVPEVSNIVDILNVMTYNYHNSSVDKFVAHPAPLYSSRLDTTEEEKKNNVDGGISTWLELGADPSKINLGVSTLGISFTLADLQNSALYAPASGPGFNCPFTRTWGVMAYNEYCGYYSDIKLSQWDEEQQVAHGSMRYTWLGIETEESVAAKVQYGLSKNLGGFMVWSVDYDDFMASCGSRTYPLTATIRRALDAL